MWTYRLPCPGVYATLWHLQAGPCRKWPWPCQCPDWRLLVLVNGQRTCSVAPGAHFVAIETRTRSSRARSRTFCTVNSCCSSDSAAISRSSEMTNTSGLSWNISFAHFWNTSLELMMPSGRRVYRPKIELHVHSLELASSRRMCHNPSFMQMTLKMRLPCSLGAMPAKARMAKWIVIRWWQRIDLFSCSLCSSADGCSCR